MATLDVEKAFDKVHHEEMFDVLLSSKVDSRIIYVLRKLHRDMSAFVQVAPAVESRRFSVQRGVRQGNPGPIQSGNVANQYRSGRRLATPWVRYSHRPGVGRATPYERRVRRRNDAHRAHMAHSQTDDTGATGLLAEEASSYTLRNAKRRRT